MADNSKLPGGNLRIKEAGEKGEPLFTKQMILDALPCDVLIIGMDGRIAEVNRRYCEYRGCSGQSLIGMDIGQVEPDARSLMAVLDNGVETRLMFREKDGLVLQSNIVEQGHTAGAVQMRFHYLDMGSAEEPEVNYYHLNEDINKLFETNWDVIYASDKNGVTLGVSSASKAIWGVEAESLIGKSVYELEKKRIFYPSVTRMVLESGRRVQAIQTTATGKKLLVLGTPIKDEKGEIIRVINTSRLIINENELYKELEETKLLVEGYKRELAYIQKQGQKEVPFIANSVKMEKVSSLAMKVSETDIAVIITGESGVGKEVLANYIHSVGSRKDKPYIKVNCGAIPPTLMESEIFGYEKGAFTGAEKTGKPGLFELANHGTLFLDEIGEIPITLQPKFLRVLQENEFMRVGGTKPVSVDVRVIAATNRDLLEEVERMVVLSPNSIIGAEDLPEVITSSRREAAVRVDEIITLREAHQLVDDMLINMAREKYSTTTQIARALGVDQSTISRKMNRKD